MPLSRKYNALYIHIPKTGGTFITNNVLRMGNKPGKEKGAGEYNFFGTANNIEYTHSTALEIKKIIGKTFNSYYSFAFVRNPFDKLVSEFFYLQKQKNANKGFIVEKNFKKFIIELNNKFHLLDNEPQYKINHYTPQHKFIMDNNNKIMIDFLGRFENFSTDIKKIMNKLNISIPVIKLNTTTHKHYTQYYDKETIKMVEEMYKEDLDLFNYIY
jgi:hypothetical protein